MATHGKLAEFDPSLEAWTSYAERLEFYFTANDITEAVKKRAILITALSPSTFELLRSLIQPAKPMEKTYAQLVKQLADHYHPKPSEIVQRFKFNTRDREPSESVSAYVAALKALAEHCKYGDSLNSMLRDRLVCGVRDSVIQKRLLQEADLTFQKAFEMAQGIEAATKNAKDILEASTSASSTVQRISQPKKQLECYRCGGSHMASTCRFRLTTCHTCKKQGHISRVCRSGRLPKTSKDSAGSCRENSRSQRKDKKSLLHTIKSDQGHSLEEPGGPTYSLFNVKGQREAKPMVVTVRLNSNTFPMEVDTGASVSVASETSLKTSLGVDKLDLQPSEVSLRTYTGESLPVLGTLEVRVGYGTQEVTLPLVVVQGEGPSLFGRNWMEVIRLDWKAINVVINHNHLQGILDKHPELFRNELGQLKGTSAKIFVDPEARPRFFKPRPISYFLRQKVDKELQRLQQEGIVMPVQFSDWATPVVPVVKRDGGIRLCGDFKVTVNREAKGDTYPLPRVEDLFAKLGRGKVFSKLDLTSAYQQIPLDPESRKLTTINTFKGLFEFNRLPFGISSAPSIFQRIMDNLLSDVPNVSVYLDDILIAGTDERDHLYTLDKVLQRLKNAGLTLKKSKCVFGVRSIQFLGHIIDEDGLHPSPDKVAAIKEARSQRMSHN